MEPKFHTEQTFSAKKKIDLVSVVLLFLLMTLWLFLSTKFNYLDSCFAHTCDVAMLRTKRCMLAQGLISLNWVWST